MHLLRWGRQLERSGGRSWHGDNIFWYWKSISIFQCLTAFTKRRISESIHGLCHRPQCHEWADDLVLPRGGRRCSRLGCWHASAVFQYQYKRRADKSRWLGREERALLFAQRRNRRANLVGLTGDSSKRGP